MLTHTGVPTADDLKAVVPSEERLARGPVAVFECFQEIPCDPCSHSCKQGAITPFEDINERPQPDAELCNGCGVCVSQCPGLAIFVVDTTYSPDQALVKLPYEYLPAPAAGDVVTGLDREGRPVGDVKVVRVQSGEKLDRTLVVWVAVPQELAMTVRNIRVEG